MLRELAPGLLFVLALVSCAGRPERQVIAVVGGERITAGELAAMLPENLDSIRADTVKKQVLDGLITRKLFAQEAQRLGMEADAEYQVELEQKALVNQQLYDTITAAGNQLTEMSLQSAYKLLLTELHFRLIWVAEESLARGLVRELDQGAAFESLAVRYSRHGSAVKGGDMGFVPLLYIDEPLRTRVMVLNPGEHTQPTFQENAWQIASLIATRPADPGPPPLGEYRQELGFRLRQQQRRALANQYLAKLRQRVTYNPAGLDIMCKPLDSITPQEKEVAVAYKDNAQYVKVARLLGAAARFPPGRDTTMRKHAVRRAIEEDLMYEDALRRGLDRLPGIRRQLAAKREEVLYRALFKQEVSDKLMVSDTDVTDYFRQNRQNFSLDDSSRVAGMIRSRLLNERREARLKEYVEELKAKSTVKINQAALAAVKREAKAPGKSKR